VSLLDIGAEVVSRTDSEETDGFGPDRALSIRDTDEVLLAPAPSSLEGKEFILNKDLSVPVWSFAAERFRRRIQADSPHSPRFDHHWANRARGKLLGAEELMRQWAETTVLLTYTGEAYLRGRITSDASSAFHNGTHRVSTGSEKGDA
jgi:hypothetical protein